jgi:hypothetical protein
MQHIDEPRLETDLQYRFSYLAQFVGFGKDDIDIIHGAAALLAPLVPALVDAIYAKLQSHDATWRHFLPRQSGYEGTTPADLTELTMEHPQIQFRKQHLVRYLEKLVTAPSDAKLVQYLDFVGKMHTSAAGSSGIQVPLVQMNALLGYVSDAILATIFGLSLPSVLQVAAARSFTKLLWLQNDLINRHYAAPGSTP